jgi:hypothetical protein
LALAFSISDINGDGYPDIYVGNDFLERDYLYINQKNRSFRDELQQWTQHISMSSMRTDIADMNNDGYPDIYTTDMLPRTITGLRQPAFTIMSICTVARSKQDTTSNS